MRKIGLTAQETLLKVFVLWVKPYISTYREPVRRGTPRGNPIGLSRSKYFWAHLQALHGPFTLDDLIIAYHKGNWEKLGVSEASNATLRYWRLENDFTKVASIATRDFADHMVSEIVFLAGDISKWVQQLAFCEAVVFLKGFALTRNPLVRAIEHSIEDLIDLRKIEQPKNYLAAYEVLVDWAGECGLEIGPAQKIIRGWKDLLC